MLSSTIRLSNADQQLIDRLSDVAGPLGPNERFAPYITCYPLTGGSHYVVARTWQDLDAPRAGCVRTRSILVPTEVWVELEDIAAVVTIATKAGASEPAQKRILDIATRTTLPEFDSLQGTELVEALFLEDRAPIVVFDAEKPELLTLRILTALWSGFRRQFAVSTFCRSPRTIGRRSFDLVFAPRDARSRFSDWPGRRIDGRKREAPRHHWSASITERVLESPFPSLKMLDAIGEMSSDGVGTEAALRVSLLWEDLRRKIYTSPNAVLGLLDIASTRTVRNTEVLHELEPAIINATNLAIKKMPAQDAWNFLSALTSKLESPGQFGSVTQAIYFAATELTTQNSDMAMHFLQGLLNQHSPSLPLLKGIAEGLSLSFNQGTTKQLASLKTTDLMRVSQLSLDLMKKIVSDNSTLPSMIAVELSKLNHPISDKFSNAILPLLVNDEQASLAEILLEETDSKRLTDYLIHLYNTNGLSSAQLRSTVVERGRKLEITDDWKDTIARMTPSNHVDSMLKELLGNERKDLFWILTSDVLDVSRRAELLHTFLTTVTPRYFFDIFSSISDVKKVIEVLNLKCEEHLRSLIPVIRHANLSHAEKFKIISILLPYLQGQEAVDWTLKAIEIALTLSEVEVKSKKLIQWLNKAGQNLSGARTIKQALIHSNNSKVITRNFNAFNECKKDAREPILKSVDEIAHQLTTRPFLGISQEAANEIAKLLWDSRNSNKHALKEAAGQLLPYLLKQTESAASPLIAATFPIVYAELEKEIPPDFFSAIFRFVDWDKCKTARTQLVSSFTRSKWSIVDLAVTAARTGDTLSIFTILSKEPNGKYLIKKLTLEIENIPVEYRTTVKYALLDLDYSNPFNKNH